VRADDAFLCVSIKNRRRKRYDGCGDVDNRNSIDAGFQVLTQTKSQPSAAVAIWKGGAAK